MVVSALTITFAHAGSREIADHLDAVAQGRSTTARTSLDHQPRMATAISPDLTRSAAEPDHGVACRIERTCQQRHRGDDEAGYAQ